MTASDTSATGVSSRAATVPLRRAAAALRVELWRIITGFGGSLRLRRAARRAGPRGLRVHLGCGTDVREGWLNVDLTTAAEAMTIARAAPRTTALVRYDLRRGLPLEEGSCSLIYSSHFFEHLDVPDGVRLMRDCRRALEHGGRFRIALPDFRRVFRAYLDGDEAFFDLIDIEEAFPHNGPGMRGLSDYVNYVVYQSGEHRTIYDTEMVLRLLRSVGFSAAAAVGYDAGIDPESTIRQRYSFYVEGVR